MMIGKPSTSSACGSADGDHVHVEPTAAYNPFTIHTTDDDQLAASVLLSDGDKNSPEMNPNNILPIADIHGDAIELRASVVRFHENPSDSDIKNNGEAEGESEGDEDEDEDRENEEKDAEFFHENCDPDLETGTDTSSVSSSNSSSKKRRRRTKEQEDEGRRSVVVTGTQLFRYLYSLGLLVFSVVVVMAALFSGQTAAAEKGIPPVGAFFIFWFLIIWLAMVSCEYIRNV